MFMRVRHQAERLGEILEINDFFRVLHSALVYHSLGSVEIRHFNFKKNFESMLKQNIMRDLSFSSKVTSDKFELNKLLSNRFFLQVKDLIENFPKNKNEVVMLLAKCALCRIKMSLSFIYTYGQLKNGVEISINEILNQAKTDNKLTDEIF